MLIGFCKMSLCRRFFCNRVFKNNFFIKKINLFGWFFFKKIILKKISIKKGLKISTLKNITQCIFFKVKVKYLLQLIRCFLKFQPNISINVSRGWEVF